MTTSVEIAEEVSESILAIIIIISGIVLLFFGGKLLKWIVFINGFLAVEDTKSDNEDDNLFVWIGNIPSNARIGQILGALNDQGYKACNKLMIKKGVNKTQWTVLKVSDLQTKQRAIKYGIKFGKSPNVTNLNVKDYLSNIKNTQKEYWGQTNTGRGRGRGRGRGANTDRGRGSRKNKLSSIGRSKTDNTYTNNENKNRVRGRGKGRGRGRGRGYANDSNYNKYNKSHQKHFDKYVGFYVTAIIDMSGSMANSRIKAATKGVAGLFSSLNDNDYVSIIGFNDKVIKILEPNEYGKVKNNISNKLQFCVDNVGGGTAMWDSVMQAVKTQKEFLQQHKNTRRKQRIIILTDGEDNRSKINSEEVIQEVAFFNLHNNKNFEFVLTVIAVGEAQKLSSLQKLCKPNFCHFVVVDDYNGIAKAFQNMQKRK